GGQDDGSSGDTGSTAEVYTPGFGWSSFPVAVNPFQHCATLLPSGRVLITGNSPFSGGGGVSAQASTAVALISPPEAVGLTYNAGVQPAAPNYLVMKPLTSGRVLAFGGPNGNQAWEFDPAANSWS